MSIGVQPVSDTYMPTFSLTRDHACIELGSTNITYLTMYRHAVGGLTESRVRAVV